VWNVPEADETRLNADRLERIWGQESKKKKCVINFNLYLLAITFYYSNNIYS